MIVDRFAAFRTKRIVVQRENRTCARVVDELAVRRDFCTVCRPGFELTFQKTAINQRRIRGPRGGGLEVFRFSRRIRPRGAERVHRVRNTV